jgi:hypothetical protein
MQTSVKLKLGNKANIENQLDLQINRAMSQFVYEIKPQESWATSTFATVADQHVYTFASDLSNADIYALMVLRDTTNDNMLSRGGVQHFYRNRRSTGKPHLWTRYGNNVILYSQVPDAAYTIEYLYVKAPTPMSADADVFPLNEEWEQPVEELAAALLWSDLNEPQNAAAKMQNYRDLLINRDKPEALEDEAGEASMSPVHNPYDRR